MKQPIKVWKFSDAPEEYRKHFYEDDADWLAVVPKKYACRRISWLDGEQFGCCHTEEIIKGNEVVKVGYHA